MAWLVFAGIFAGTLIGAYDRESFRRLWLRHHPELSLCYDQGRMENDGLYGRVIFTLTLAKDGTVATLQVKESTSNAPKVDQCLLDSVRSWRFHKPRKNTGELRFPIFMIPE